MASWTTWRPSARWCLISAQTLNNSSSKLLNRWKRRSAESFRTSLTRSKANSSPSSYLWLNLVPSSPKRTSSSRTRSHSSKVTKWLLSSPIWTGLSAKRSLGYSSPKWTPVKPHSTGEKRPLPVAVPRELTPKITKASTLRVTQMANGWTVHSVSPRTSPPHVALAMARTSSSEWRCLPKRLTCRYRLTNSIKRYNRE